jgi:hypothetical protein
MLWGEVDGWGSLIKIKGPKRSIVGAASPVYNDWKGHVGEVMVMQVGSRETKCMDNLRL